MKRCGRRYFKKTFDNLIVMLIGIVCASFYRRFEVKFTLKEGAAPEVFYRSKAKQI
jgi:hypothetical protein